jgi:hypothetical protein
MHSSSLPSAYLHGYVVMARYRIDELKSGDVSMLITLLGKIGISPGERDRMDCQPIGGKRTP